MAVKHPLKWFTNRIGKRIYRKPTTCTCQKCKDVANDGLLVGNEFHAQYIHICQYDLGIDYFDKPFKK